MIAIDIEKSKWCAECPIYNDRSDTCKITGQGCRTLWRDITDEEVLQYQNSICPLIEITDTEIIYKITHDN